MIQQTLIKVNFFLTFLSVYGSSYCLFEGIVPFFCAIAIIDCKLYQFGFSKYHQNFWPISQLGIFPELQQVGLINKNNYMSLFLVASR